MKEMTNRNVLVVFVIIFIAFTIACIALYMKSTSYNVVTKELEIAREKIKVLEEKDLSVFLDFTLYKEIDFPSESYIAV